MLGAQFAGKAAVGLGLSIVHDMVVWNFGTVRAENLPGGGACFTVVFPYAEKEETK